MNHSMQEVTAMWQRTVLAIALVVSALTPAWSQEWATKMFETTSHDFGTVARGAKAEYEFVFSNIYVEDVHVASVRTSCGCTTPVIKTPSLKTYEKGAILAIFNTPKFIGQRGATLTVTFDKPYYAEVQLQVSGYIRSDVVLDPGSAEFGTVEQGTAAEKTLAINYAGRDDWEIVDVKSANPHLSGKVVETRRGDGLVSYNLVVRIDENAPVGYVDDHLVLVTNDRSSTEVPVPVEGIVQAGIRVSPASLFMGVVQPGQKVTKQVVVKGNKPFRIISVNCDGKDFHFDTSKDKTPKELHLIPVTFVAGKEPGKVSKTIRIETDLGDASQVLSAYAVVAQ
jgi:hypothetical protein